MNKLRIVNTLIMMYKNEDYVLTDYDVVNYLLKTGLVIEINGSYKLTPYGLVYVSEFIKNNTLSLCNYTISNGSNENCLSEEHIQNYISVRKTR